MTARSLTPPRPVSYVRTSQRPRPGLVTLTTLSRIAFYGIIDPSPSCLPSFTAGSCIYSLRVCNRSPSHQVRHKIMGRGKGRSETEIVKISQACIYAIEDPITGIDQTAMRLSKTIFERFSQPASANEIDKFFGGSTSKSIKSKFSKNCYVNSESSWISKPCNVM